MPRVANLRLASRMRLAHPHAQSAVRKIRSRSRKILTKSKIRKIRRKIQKSVAKSAKKKKLQKKIKKKIRRRKKKSVTKSACAVAKFSRAAFFYMWFFAVTQEEMWLLVSDRLSTLGLRFS